MSINAFELLEQELADRLKFRTLAEIQVPTTTEEQLWHTLDQYVAALYRAAFGIEWWNAAPECCCGRRMQRLRVPYHNSGTTRILYMCREAEPYRANGHQWAVTTSAEHFLETDGNCCGDLRASMEVCG